LWFSSNSVLRSGDQHNYVVYKVFVVIIIGIGEENNAVINNSHLNLPRTNFVNISVLCSLTACRFSDSLILVRFFRGNENNNNNNNNNNKIYFYIIF